MSVGKRIKKTFSKWIIIPCTNYYLSKERRLKIGAISLIIPPGVFHPALFFSTQFLLSYIDTLTIGHASILELGAGSGFLSIAMAKRNATVAASDISVRACQAVQQNAALNEVVLDVIHSDLFDDINRSPFDLVVINPPYYPQDPKSESDRAWFCGKNFDYFQKLFRQLPDFLNKDGFAVMVLSEDCRIDTISQLATNANLSWHKAIERKIKGEWNYIFTITANRT